MVEMGMVWMGREGWDKVGWDGMGWWDKTERRVGMVWLNGAQGHGSRDEDQRSGILGMRMVGMDEAVGMGMVGLGLGE